MKKLKLNVIFDIDDGTFTALRERFLLTMEGPNMCNGSQSGDFLMYLRDLVSRDCSNTGTSELVGSINSLVSVLGDVSQIPSAMNILSGDIRGLVTQLGNVQLGSPIRSEPVDFNPPQPEPVPIATVIPPQSRPVSATGETVDPEYVRQKLSGLLR